MHTLRRSLKLGLIALGLLGAAAAAAQSLPWQTNVEVVGSLPLPGTARAVAVEGNHAFVASYNDSDAWITSIDVSDPSNPRIQSATPLPGGISATDLVAKGNRLYTIPQGDRYLIDSTGRLTYETPLVEPRSDQAIRSIFADDEGAFFLIGKGANAYSETGFLGHKTLDGVTSDTGFQINSGSIIGKVDDHLFVSGMLPHHTDFKLINLDVSNPAEVRTAGEIILPVFTDVLGDVEGMIGALAYNGETHLANLAADPTFVFPGWAYGYARCKMDNRLIYTFSGRTLTVLSATDPVDPVPIRGVLEMPDSPDGLAVAGQLAYVACSEWGLVIARYTGPDAPLRFTDTIPASYRRGTIGSLKAHANPAVAGTIPRLELWRNGQKLMDLTTPYDPDGNLTALFFLPFTLEPGDGYAFRLISTWDPTIGIMSKSFSITK